MMKDIAICPECGRKFEEVGVIELRCYYRDTDEYGVVIDGGCFEETRFECGHCGRSLDHRGTESYDIQIIG